MQPLTRQRDVQAKNSEGVTVVPHLEHDSRRNRVLQTNQQQQQSDGWAGQPCCGLSKKTKHTKPKSPDYVGCSSSRIYQIVLNHLRALEPKKLKLKVGLSAQPQARMKPKFPVMN